MEEKRFRKLSRFSFYDNSIAEKKKKILVGSKNVNINVTKENTDSIEN